MKEFKILSLQPFSIYANGGGSRILRRLYQGRENRVVSIAIIDTPSSQQTESAIKEITFTKAYLIKPWMRWKLRDFLLWLRLRPFFIDFVTNKVIKVIANIDYDVVHAVDHGPYAGISLNKKVLQNKSLWVSFHDCFASNQQCLNQTRQFWTISNRRLVISNELGEYYCKLFGDQPYEMITDGVSIDEICEPKNAHDFKYSLNIYFSGLLHVGYYELFNALANALDSLSLKGFDFTFILRGTQPLDFFKNRSFKVEYRPFTLNVDELKKEQDAADILYLPIKFNDERFYLYSLSTKMVGYLAAPGTILYHGPDNSAACNLLKKHNAALCSSSLNTEELVNSILELNSGSENYSENAKKLALKEFNLTAIQKRFWLERI